MSGLKEGTFTLSAAISSGYLMGKDHHADYMMALDIRLAEFTFTDCLHDRIGCDEVQVPATANQ